MAVGTLDLISNLGLSNRKYCIANFTFYRILGIGRLWGCRFGTVQTGWDRLGSGLLLGVCRILKEVLPA